MTKLTRSISAALGAVLVFGLRAQDCGNCADQVKPAQTGGCAESLACADGPLTAARALEIATATRAHVCASISKVELQNHLGFVTDGDTAERLAARIREAATVDAAVGAIFAQRDAAAAPASPVDGQFAFAPMLSATGFYRDVAGKQIADGFVPYVINSPLWSDGAHKDRFVRVPAGQQIGFRADSEWEFPVGTTFLQTMFFEDAGVRVYTETRVIVRGERELQFASYLWDDEFADAALVDETGDDTYALHGDVSQLWSIAAREDCAKCHNSAVDGHTLGITTAQWNRPSVDGATNQLTAFARRGLLDGVPADLTALPALTDPLDVNAPLAARARSYLATNCSACHRPGGPGSGTLDLRVDTPLARTGLLARNIVMPSRVARSRILGRMASVDWDRMPSLLSTVPDDSGMAMLRDWIATLEVTDAPATPKPASPMSCCDDGAADGCGSPDGDGCGSADGCGPADAREPAHDACCEPTSGRK